MKKSAYLVILAIVTVVCILGGTAYRFAGCGREIASHIDNFDMEVSDTESWGSEKSLKNEKQEPFTGISVDTDVMDVTIVQGDGYYLSYDCSEKLVPKYSVQDGTLVVTQSGNNKITWGMNNVSCDMQITVPEGTELDSLTIKSDVGDIEIDDVEAKNFDVTASVGDINVENAGMGESSFSADTGNITLTDCTYGNLTVDSSVGDVELTSGQSLEGYTLNLTTDVGSVEYQGEKYEHKYKVDGTNGKTITVKNSVGDVTID